MSTIAVLKALRKPKPSLLMNGSCYYLVFKDQIFSRQENRRTNYLYKSSNEPCQYRLDNFS
jgi:hypothetical protein